MMTHPTYDALTRALAEARAEIERLRERVDQRWQDVADDAKQLLARATAAEAIVARVDAICADWYADRTSAADAMTAIIGALPAALAETAPAKTEGGE